jgi:hypothetical protein
MIIAVVVAWLRQQQNDYAAGNIRVTRAINIDIRAQKN